MTTPTITLARILDLDVPRTWPEVVATILAAGEAMQATGFAPGADDCALSPDGRLDLHDNGFRHGGSADALVALLAALLQGQSAPPELLALTDQAVQATRNNQLDNTMDALAYFARPDSRSEIAALAARSLAADREVLALHDLGARGPAPRPAAEAPSPMRGRVKLAVGLWAILFVLLGSMWYFRDGVSPAAQSAGSEPRSAIGSLLSAASRAIETVMSEGVRGVRSVPPDVPPGDVSPTPDAPAGARAGARARPRAPVAAPSEGDVVELPIVAGDPANASGVLPDVSIFTAADTDVLPPVLAYPQLPSEPRADRQRTGPAYFDLLVSSQGQVEQVYLRAAEPRYYDRMLVAAAKAWRFRPATREGQPVRYWIRVPIVY